MKEKRTDRQTLDRHPKIIRKFGKRGENGVRKEGGSVPPAMLTVFSRMTRRERG